MSIVCVARSRFVTLGRWNISPAPRRDFWQVDSGHHRDADRRSRAGGRAFARGDRRVHQCILWRDGPLEGLDRREGGSLWDHLILTPTAEDFESGNIPTRDRRGSCCRIDDLKIEEGRLMPGSTFPDTEILFGEGREKLLLYSSFYETSLFIRAERATKTSEPPL